ncbi:glycosyltransferase family 4 protein [Methylocaldum szegediense]|uniref:Glycosyltransferase involved in cell wall biosynthesis n=1 Tax=Methylocaldum szegediense TaxID=73780 RepID=A0ABN8X5J6_9GAMM|nr:glycosyltransferase family 4 protein [Methylocaldum szegediense]CAI8891391.1 Glycosyltransferase involved in cell wall biosynthesis [Methylocaldum szegediense]
MRFVFLHPPLDAYPSGGNVFNRRIIALARDGGFPLETVELAPNGRVPSLPRDAIVLWDSLLLENLSNCPSVGNGAAQGILAHYVPFLNPLLHSDQRRVEEERFDSAARRCRFFITTGLSVRRFLERRFPGLNVQLCEPGVDDAFPGTRRPWSEPDEARTVHVVTVANFLPAKGLSELLETLADLRHYDWVWHLAGDERMDAGYAEFFRSRVRELGLQTRVRLHGVLEPPELARLLGEMDVFAFASRYEAYGMALAEAAAVGLPTVTTDVGEARRIVRHEETGLIAPVADRNAFRSDSERLLSDSALRRRFRARLLLHRPRTWDDAFTDFRNALRAVCEELAPAARSP